MTVSYPHIHVKLVGTDGNAFFLIARVRQALQRANVPADEIKAFCKEAMSGDYDHVLQTILATVNAS